MRNSVSDVTDAEILDEAREAMTQAAFDAADEANAAQAVESATESLPAFDELGLSDEMLRAIENLGYTAPTPVQAGSIPVVLEGRDLLAAAQTGTGKTAAFLLPTMNNLEHIAPPKPVRERGGRNRRRGAKKPEGNGRGPVMLVITPTRELAQQIDEVASKIADVTGHVAVTVVGGVSYKPQTAALKYGCDILVATPGRLVDLIEQGACHLDEVKVLVLDEADRMLDMGFLPAVRRIVRETPAERQALLFSATLDEEAVGEITDLVSDPARVEIAPATSTADTVDQFVFPVSIEAKNNLLPEFLKKEGPERTIVFMRTKHRADSCCRRLERKGIKAAAIHGNRSQTQRERALSAFRDGTVDVLVATDVLARGIDISDVRYVVNFDVPAEPTDYIHRIGRTGRAGELGWAITFVTEQDVDEFYEIEKLMDKTADIYEAGDLHVGPNPPAVDPERDPAAFKVKKKTKRGKSKSKKKLEQARRDGKRNGDDYGDVAGRSNRGRDERRGDGERPSRPKRGGKTRVREGVQARVDEAVESVAREVLPRSAAVLVSLSRPRAATVPSAVPSSSRARRIAVAARTRTAAVVAVLSARTRAVARVAASVVRAIVVVPVAMASAAAVMSAVAARAAVRVASVVLAAASPVAASALMSAVAVAASIARALVAMAAAAVLAALTSRAIAAIRVPAAIVAMTGATTTIPARSVVAAIVAGMAATRPAPAAAVPAVAIIVVAMAIVVAASAAAAPVAPVTAAASASNIRIAR